MAVLLRSGDALRRMTSQIPSSSLNMLAFYSSHFGGIVTEPALMVIPVDDHAFHRGHAVFDTCNVCDGQAFGLDFHLDRLIKSAQNAKIELGEWSKEKFLNVILATIAAAGQREGVFVRYWLSAGRGDFYVSSKNCIATSFFVVVHGSMPGSGRYPPVDKPAMKAAGVREYIVSVPMKPKLLANIKSNNYLLNALTCMESEAQGGFLGIQTDSHGQIGEGAIGNVAIVDKQGYIRTPPFDNVLAGTTVERVRALQMELVTKGLIKGVEFSELSPSDLRNAKEAFSLGGGGVVPIVAVNDVDIGEGKPGRVFAALEALLARDMRTSHRHPIPFDRFQPRAADSLLAGLVAVGWWAASGACFVGAVAVGGWALGKKPLTALAVALDA